MEKNEKFQIVIEDISENGEGIGHADGYTLFVKGALIGDEIEGVVVKAKKTYGFGRLLRVVQPGPDRVEPKCPVAGPCGGCQIQAMSYEGQLKFKARKVREHIVRLGGFDPEYVDSIMEPIVGAADPWRYRNKAQMPFSTGKDGRAICGFYAGRTHSVIENDDCLIEHPTNALITESIKHFMDEYNVPVYDEVAHRGVLRHALIRSSRATGDMLVCLVANRDEKVMRRRSGGKDGRGRNAVSDNARITLMGDEFRDRGKDEVALIREISQFFPNIEVLVERLAMIPGVATVTLNINDKKTNVILGDETRVLYGPGFIREKIDGVSYRISTRSFFQVNPEQTEKLYATALEYAGLTGSEEVWDLYCGTGSISLYVARYAKTVHGVEIIEDAVKDAKVNASENGMTNVDFVCAKSEDILPEHAAKGERADVIIVDPPRKGCEQALLEAACVMKPERIVYVSCNSATLARDMAILAERGYKPVRIRPVDMFPMTVGCETVALMEKAD